MSLIHWSSSQMSTLLEAHGIPLLNVGNIYKKYNAFVLTLKSVNQMDSPLWVHDIHMVFGKPRGNALKTRWQSTSIWFTNFTFPCSLCYEVVNFKNIHISQSKTIRFWIKEFKHEMTKTCLLVTQHSVLQHLPRDIVKTWIAMWSPRFPFKPK